MLIPQHHPSTAHYLQSDPRVDTVAVLDLAAHTTGYADMNACRLLDGDANVHWPKNPVSNHYSWIWTGRRTKVLRREIRREMTDEERRRPVNEWTTWEFLRWRRGAKGGARPHTVGMRQRQARRRFVKVCWELKSHDYGDNPAWAMRFVSTVKAAGGVAFYFTLATMPKWGPRMRAFRNAGGQTALDINGAKAADVEPALPAFEEFIDATWGHFA
jgi:hypothetical protein